MQMTPLYWVYFGVVLLILEVMTPGFVILFFGLSALTVALFAFLFAELGEGWQWLLFSLFSVGYIVLLRKTLKQVFHGNREVSESLDDNFTGRLAEVIEPVAPARPGRVAFLGTTWTAEAVAPIPAGAAVRIVGKKNLTLVVEALPKE